MILTLLKLLISTFSKKKFLNNIDIIFYFQIVLLLIFYNILVLVYDKSPLHYCKKKIKLMSSYAFFKGWLLLSLPLSCHYLFLLFITPYLRTLTKELGFFPFDYESLHPQSDYEKYIKS